MKYPVSEKKCKNCPSCSLVTKDVAGNYIDEKERYYQCISMAESYCEETNADN